jgi:hypothetical protein
VHGEKFFNPLNQQTGLPGLNEKRADRETPPQSHNMRHPWTMYGQFLGMEERRCLGTPSVSERSLFPVPVSSRRPRCLKLMVIISTWMEWNGMEK